MSQVRMAAGSAWRDLPPALPALAGVAVLVAWSTDQGGYFASSWYPGALFLLAVLAVTALVDRASFRRLPRATQVALGAFALFTAWTYLSITWADAKGVAWDGANRTLLYLIVFALFSRSVASERSLGLALGAWAAAITGLAVVVLLKLPATVGGEPGTFKGGLEQPLGYSNANAAIWLMALWPSLALASCRDVAPWLRGLFAAAIVVLAETSLLSESRGSLVTTAVVVAVLFLTMPGRVRTLLTLLGPACAIALTTPHVLNVANAAGRDPAASSQLGSVAAPVLLAALACGLAVFAAGALAAHRPPSRPMVRTVRRAVTLAGIGLVLAGIVGGLVVAGDPVDRVHHSWHEFKQAGAPTPDSPGHLTAGFGGARYDYYRVALDVFGEHPFAGIGIDNFAQDYLARGQAGERPTSPHSLELRTMLQTGIVGTALLLVAMGAAFVAVSRALRGASALGRAAAAGAALTCLYWIVQGSADWFWEFPALGGAAFAALGIAGAAAPRRDAPDLAAAGARWTVRLRILGTAVLVVAAAGAFVFPWTADIEVRRAEASWNTFPAEAYRQLELAAKLNPLSEQPGITAGAIAVRRGEVDRARGAFEQALRRDPRNAYATLWLGAIASHQGQRDTAQSLLRRALELAPLDPVTQSAAKQVKSGRIDLAALSGRVAKFARLLHH